MMIKEECIRIKSFAWLLKKVNEGIDNQKIVVDIRIDKF